MQKPNLQKQSQPLVQVSLFSLLSPEQCLQRIISKGSSRLQSPGIQSQKTLWGLGQGSHLAGSSGCGTQTRQKKSYQDTGGNSRIMTKTSSIRCSQLEYNN